MEVEDDFVFVLLEQIDRLKERVDVTEGQIQAMNLQISELVTLDKIRNRPTKASAMNVCALDADRDSAECSEATVYRHQQGCRGVACVRRYQDYYSDYRKRQQEVVDTEPDTVE